VKHFVNRFTVKDDYETEVWLCDKTHKKRGWSVIIFQWATETVCIENLHENKARWVFGVLGSAFGAKKEIAP